MVEIGGKKGFRDGICHFVCRYTKSNDKQMKDFVESKKS